MSVTDIGARSSDAAARVARRCRWAGSACLALVLSGPSASWGQLREVSPAEVKAAYVMNFLRYTEWPAASFQDGEAPIVVEVLEDEDVAESLRDIVLRAPMVGERAVEIRFSRLPPRRLQESDPLLAALRRSQVVYVDESDTDRAARIVQALAGHDVLTVGGQPGFAALGGMIGLREEGRRIAFDANPRAIRQSRLQVSARVLQLARVVEPREP